jgi:uncharacterized protein YigE (DUF2233 family)
MRIALAAALVVLSCRVEAALPSPWRELMPGLSYRHFDAGGSTYHAVRIDLGVLDIGIADARRGDRRVATAAELLDESGALVAINGTFFDEHQRPLGLLVADGKETNRLRDVSWWAAFVVRDEGGRRTADILTTAELKALSADQRARLRTALQVGPRTVADGKALRLKKQAAARSAVCVVTPTEVIVVATENGPVESNELAAVMTRAAVDDGLGCRDGLMFDGGLSTQLHVRTPAFKLDLRGGSRVPNALVVRAP